MGKIFIGFVILIIAGLVILNSDELVNAKSENSNSGNQSSNSNSNSSNDDEEDNSSGNSGKNETKEEKNSNTSSGKKSDDNNEKKSLNSGQGSLNQGRGNAFNELDEDENEDDDVIEIEDEIEATAGSKLKKLDKVVVKEASASAQGTRRAIQGLITSIEGSIINLVHQIQRDREFIVSFDDSTEIKQKDSSASATLQVGQRIIAIGDLLEDGKILARRIHIIPGKAVGIFKKNPIATSSAQPSASSSASVTPTSSPSATPLPSSTP